MYFVIFGVRDSKLKSKPVAGNTTCSKCNSVGSFDVKGTASYFHLFWIPIIPLMNEIEFVCRNCGQHHYKKTAPKPLLASYNTMPLKRPWWHFLVLAFLAYKIVSLLIVLAYYEVDSMIQKSENETKIENQNEERQFHLEQLNADFANASNSPLFENDSISYLLHTKVDFGNYEINGDEVKINSTVKNNMVLTLFQIDKFNIVETADQYLFLKDVRDIINKSYEQPFNAFIGVKSSDGQLFVSSANSNIETYDFVKNSDYYNYPFKHYYENDSVSTYNIISRREHDKLLYEYEGKSQKRVELDTTRLLDVWGKINTKFKFKYKSKIDPLPKKVFLESSETLLPEDLRFFFKYQNLNGPFVKLGELKVRLQQLSYVFYNTPIGKLQDKSYKDSSKRVVSLSSSPRWLPFYEDYTYKYAMDLLPDENGYIGQIVQLGQNGEPSKFIAKDLVSFLELYLNEKVPTDIGDWN